MLLFDQNLSPRLADRLSDVFPGCGHVRSVGLASAADAAVWAHARAASLILVSKDSDFVDLAVVRGVPPYVVCVQAGNQTTARDEALLRRHAAEIRARRKWARRPRAPVSRYGRRAASASAGWSAARPVVWAICARQLVPAATTVAPGALRTAGARRSSPIATDTA